MNSMILAVDIGNSFTNLGLFQGNKLIRKLKFPTIKKLDSDKIHRFVSKGHTSLKSAGISSVVPEMNQYWKMLLKNNFDVTPLFVSSVVAMPLRLNIENPQKLGSDRISNAVAGYEISKRKYNVLVIDLGTATTYDIVLKNGDYIGGIISPGIETSAQALYLRTSKLPLLEHKKLTFPKEPIGRNTNDAMRSGIMYSALDSMENMIKRLEKFLNVKFKIILTGGLSKLVADRLSFDHIRRSDLVLTGINYILSYRHGN